MENSDVFRSSTAPHTWHDFLERMRHPSAADFVKSIKSFIVTFSNNVPDPEKDSAAVQEFLSNMEGAFRAHSLWAGCSDEELESAGEGLEKYVMTKLFNRAFASLPEDVKQDEQLYEKMALIQQFIRPEYLDIKPTFQNETSWLLAQKELQKMNMCKAPRDKLVCILNCCKVINNLLLNASISSNENPPGADEFLPVLIYVTIKANPPQLHSNLLYIQRFRRQSRLVSEAAYFFTNILSVESFIWNIDAKSLSMDDIEFERNMESARALLSGLSGNFETVYSQTDQVADSKLQKGNKEKQNSPLPPQGSMRGESTKGTDEKMHSLIRKPSVLDLEGKGASELLKDDEVSGLFREYPFLFAHTGDLTVDDVEALLSSYKQLVLKYVSLSKGLGLDAPSLPMDQTQIQNQTHKESDITTDDNTTDDNTTDDSNKKYEVIPKPDDDLNRGSSVDTDGSDLRLPPPDHESDSHSTEEIQS